MRERETQRETETETETETERERDRQRERETERERGRERWFFGQFSVNLSGRKNRKKILFIPIKVLFKVLKRAK